MPLVEACVDTIFSALEAQRGGADRLELCDNLGDAGTTPSHGTLQLTLERLAIPVFPMIRPRGGAFVYDEAEVAIMRADVRHCRELGALGAVIGALDQNGDIDERTIRLLRDDAGSMALTFHRAFDVCRDPAAALETLIELGINRVLTSGGKQTAWEGRVAIATLVRQAGNRIVIMAGSGIDAGNAAELMRRTGVTEMHLRGADTITDPGRRHDIRFRSPLPLDELSRQVTDASRIAAVKHAVYADPLSSAITAVP